jgi:bifunctional non-homologous end joining protein LigD
MVGGPTVFKHARRMGLEVLVAKHRDSPYRGGRFDRWIKVKNRQHPAFSQVMEQF